YCRRSWRPMVHAICNCSKEDERCRSARERDRHALCRTGYYRSRSFGGSAAGDWRICSLAVVAESSIRRMALLRGRNFDRSSAVGPFLAFHEILSSLVFVPAVLDDNCIRRAWPGGRQQNSCGPRSRSKNRTPVERLDHRAHCISIANAGCVGTAQSPVWTPPP